MDVRTHHGRDQDGAGSHHERIAATMDLMHAHECALANRVLAHLKAKGARILGPETAEPHKRAATIAFVPRRSTPQAVMDHCASRNIIIGGGGDFYARRLVEAVGIDPGKGVARVSLVHYNCDADVDRLLEALDEVI